MVFSLLALDTILLVIMTILPMMISVAFFTLSESKVMAFVQRRKGPDVVGWFGVLQPIADAFKLILAEPIMAGKSAKFMFLIAPMIPFIFSLTAWSFFPLSFEAMKNNSNISLLYLFPMSVGSVYGMILAGWASNSKYALLGAFSTVAQLMSYDISMLLIMLPVIISAGSLNISEIVYAQESIWYCVPLMSLSMIFFITMLAETNRAPFDLPEAEAELVAGFNVEYSSIIFAFFFLAEYSSMIGMSMLFVFLFLGGWTVPVSFVTWLGILQFPLSMNLIFLIKAAMVFFLFIFVSSNFPRYRFDQLMHMGWKIFLPLALSHLILNVSLLFFFNGFP